MPTKPGFFLTGACGVDGRYGATGVDRRGATVGAGATTRGCERTTGAGEVRRGVAFFLALRAFTPCSAGSAGTVDSLTAVVSGTPPALISRTLSGAVRGAAHGVRVLGT